jgi:hypothetical protein
MDGSMFWPIVAASLLAAPVAAAAQIPEPVETLGRCLADSTSGKDRKELAKWVFLGMAVHPEMRQFASADLATAADESSRTIAALVTRLLTDSCASETQTVIRAGGSTSTSFQVAFERLGQLAMRELMSDKSVNESMTLFQRYLDRKRFEEAFADK